MGVTTRNANQMLSNVEPVTRSCIDFLPSYFVSDFLTRTILVVVVFPKRCYWIVVHYVSSTLGKMLWGEFDSIC